MPALPEGGSNSQLEWLLAWASGLVAERAGGLALAQLCRASREAHAIICSDAEALRVLDRRALFATVPYRGPWGLEAHLAQLGKLGVAGHSGASGGFAIGTCGLRAGCAAFHFVVQDFPGVLFGVTSRAPASKWHEVLDVDSSALFSISGALLGTPGQVNEPHFVQWPFKPEMLLSVILAVDMDEGSVSIDVRSHCSKFYRKMKVVREDLRARPGCTLFPVIMATHMAESLFASGSAVCEAVVA